MCNWTRNTRVGGCQLCWPQPERARPSEASPVEGGGQGPRVWEPFEGSHHNRVPGESRTPSGEYPRQRLRLACLPLHHRHVEPPRGREPRSPAARRRSRALLGEAGCAGGYGNPPRVPITICRCVAIHTLAALALGGIRTRNTALRRRGPDPVLVEDERPGGEARTPDRSLIERLLCLELRQVGARDGNRTRLTRSTAGQPLQMLTRAGSERKESNLRLRFVGPRPSHWATLRLAWPELNRQSPGPRPGGFPASLHAV
jgi:hypothetical protein